MKKQELRYPYLATLLKSGLNKVCVCVCKHICVYTHNLLCYRSAKVVGNFHIYIIYIYMFAIKYLQQRKLKRKKWVKELDVFVHSSRCKTIANKHGRCSNSLTTRKTQVITLQILRPV